MLSYLLKLNFRVQTLGLSLALRAYVPGARFQEKQTDQGHEQHMNRFGRQHHHSSVYKSFLA